MSQNLQKVNVVTDRITTDVTAIKLLKNRIIAGIGGSLHLFIFKDNGSTTLERIIEIFDGQKVHALIFSDNFDKLIVHGGKQFCILDVLTFERVDDVHLLSHWIHAAHWMDDRSIAFALSNNSVCLWKDRKVAASVLCSIQCIIYSALLLGSTWDNLTIFSGTVFSEVLIWGTEGKIWHQLKGHKGVIFSITFDEKRQRILTSSDDRSVRVWQKSVDFWSACKIIQLHELYGHQSRVWRALAADFGLVSIGEDSVICQWDEHGKEISKVCAHQGGSIWSADLRNSLLVTGGGDGGIMAWNIGQLPEASMCDLNVDVRRVACTKDGCLLMLSEEGKLFTQTSTNDCKEVPCVSGQIVQAHVDLVFILSIDGFLTVLKGIPEEVNFVARGKVSEKTVLSLCVLNASTFLISTVDGLRTFWSLENEVLEKRGSFSISSKSKGASCGILIDRSFLIGDQDGYLQLVTTNSSIEMAQSVNLKSEGVTGLCFYRGLIWATCKEGKLMNLRLVNGQLEVINSGQPRLGMIAGLNATSEGLLLYSFHKEHFTAWSWDQQRPIFRFHCPGGGHRPWSFQITSQNVLKFSYIRHKKVHFFESPVAHIIAPAIRVGLHLRLVNCMVPLDETATISGGEDGSLRIYDTDSGSPMTVVQAHLSSVKTLLKSKTLLISAGGRAQLIVWNLEKQDDYWILKQLHNHMLLDGDKPIKVPWRDTYLNPRPDPETRYMSLCVLSHDTNKLIFLAACSDSLLRVFECSEEEKSVKIINTISHHKNCVLSVSSSAGKIVSGSSDGVIAIWTSKTLLTTDATPLWSAKVHQGGVTSLVITAELYIFSGGDDGIFRVGCFETGQLTTVFESQNATQLTGIEVVGNFAVSSSSGQQVTLWERIGETWSKKYERLSTVADLQGITVIKSSKVSTKICIFGKGSEVVSLSW